MTEERLKLRIKDAEDVQVVSAVLQDSIVPVCDMVFQHDAGIFIVVAQRLRHEANGRPEGTFERICSALTISGVKGVQAQGIDQHNPDQLLEMLAIILEPSRCLTFVFAGGASLRLELEGWTGVVEDFGDSWPALCHPCHEDEFAKKGS